MTYQASKKSSKQASKKTDFTVDLLWWGSLRLAPISKAFDSICHKELLDKLYSIGVKGRLWEWFKCYLSGRRQKVQINSCQSSLLPVISGVPQGSILGPLLFIIYMNDLPGYINLAKSLMFVDDTKCYSSIRSSLDSDILQKDLDSIVSWSRKWNLSFNPTKSVVVSNKQQFETVYNISSTQVATREYYKDLGIIFSQDMLLLLLLLLLLLYGMYADLQSTLVVTVIVHTKFKCTCQGPVSILR